MLNFLGVLIVELSLFLDKHDHHDHDHHDKHHKHHKHHDHTRGGSDRHSGGNGASESQQAGAREDEEDNQDSPNQSHVHIHLKIAGELDGQRVETCPPQDDVYPKDGEQIVSSLTYFKCGSLTLPL